MPQILVSEGAVYTATFTQHETTPRFSVTAPDTSELKEGDIIYLQKIVGSTEEGATEGEKPSAVFTGFGKLATIDDYGQAIDPAQYVYGIGTQHLIEKVSTDGKSFQVKGSYDTSGDNSKRTIEFHRRLDPTVVQNLKKEDSIDYPQDPAVPEEVVKPDGWGRWTMASSGTLVDIAEQVKTLAEALKSSSNLAMKAMTAVKWIAELNAANAYAAVLNELADNMLAAIKDLKNAGYWYLLVDPYSDPKTVNPEPHKKLGWKHLRDGSGRRIWWKPLGHVYKDEDGKEQNILPEDTTCSDGSPRMAELLRRPLTEDANCPNSAEVDAGWEPKLAIPRKIVRGGYNPRADWMVDAFQTMSPFPQYNAKKVVKTMISSLQDEGDVPRYAVVAESSEIIPQAGSIVFDYDGNPVLGWDPKKVYGQPLYDKGAKKENGSPYTGPEGDELGPLYWKNVRNQINQQISVGRPLIDGSTINFNAFQQIDERNTFSIEEFKKHVGFTKESYSTPCSAVVFIVGAISFNHFTTSFNNFSKLFSDLEALGGGMMDSLEEAYNKLTNPEPYTLKLTMCDQNYGLFTEGDAITGVSFGGLAEIVSVNSQATVATSMVSTILTTQTDDTGETRERFKEVDINSNGRYMDMEVDVIPLSNPEDDGIKSFTVNDTVYELEKKGKFNQKAAAAGAPASESPDNYQVKGSESAEQASLNTTVNSAGKGTVKDGAKRIYPKYGVVAMEKLVVPRESVKPDFKGITIGEMIPMWNQVFEYIEGYISQVKGYVATSSSFIQDMIDTINGMIEFLDDLVKTILEFLKFFETDLSNSGIYSLHISNSTSGTAGIAQELGSATGLPDNLDYAMGIMFIGNGDSGPLLDTFFGSNIAGKGKGGLKYGESDIEYEVGDSVGGRLGAGV